MIRVNDVIEYRALKLILKSYQTKFKLQDNFHHLSLSISYSMYIAAIKFNLHCQTRFKKQWHYGSTDKSENFYTTHTFIQRCVVNGNSVASPVVFPISNNANSNPTLLKNSLHKTRHLICHINHGFQSGSRNKLNKGRS